MQDTLSGKARNNKAGSNRYKEKIDLFHNDRQAYEQQYGANSGQGKSFNQMTYIERLNLSTNNPNEYKRLLDGGEPVTKQPERTLSPSELAVRESNAKLERLNAEEARLKAEMEVIASGDKAKQDQLVWEKFAEGLNKWMAENNAK